MSRVIKVQTNFAVGEINPELRGRIDLRQYESALERARNVICKPQGSIERRPGLRFLYEIPSAASPQNGVRLVPFQFSTTQTYMLIFVGTRMYIFREGTQVTGINGGSDDFLDVSSSVSGVTDGVTSARLSNLWYTQSADTLLLFEETMTPLKIVRGASHSTWTVSDLSFDYIPKFAFTLTETNPAATLTPSKVDGAVTLTAGSAVFHDGDTGTAQAGGSSTITLKSGALATDDIYNGATVRITGGTGNGQTRIISDYVGSSKVATVSSAWTTQPDATSTYTVSSVVGQYCENTNNFGRARIVSFTSTTVVEAQVEIPFFNTSSISSGNWVLESGYEDAWSTYKGWPRSAAFHEGRLLVGGAQNLPTTIWGSRVGQFFNFDPGQSLDDEGLEATIDTDQVNAIVGVFSGRDFQVFTTGTEFVVPQLDGEPLSPLNFIFKPSTRRGSQSGTRPVSTEGGTLYLQRGGKAIREFLFSDIEGSYISNDISMLSSHLLQTPSRMAMRRGTNVDEGDLLHIVNSGDGSMAVFSILRSQNVVAPSLITTSGTFEDVGVEDADVPLVYAVVKRTINSATVYYLEVFDNNHTTDASYQYTSAASNLPGSTSVSSLNHLEGQSVKVIADDAMLSDETVSSNAITTDRTATTYLEIGLEYPSFTDTLANATKSTPLARTMPVETRLPQGPVLGGKKRVVRVSAILDNTQSMTINGVDVPFRALGSDLLDEGVSKFTGTKQIGPFLGYDRKGQVEVTQSQPLFMTLLALDYRVSVSPGD